MSRKPLSDQLKGFYDGHTPSLILQEQLLNSYQQQLQLRKGLSRRNYLAFAAGLVLAVTIWAIMGQLTPAHIDQRIAQEIALNHEKRLKLEFFGKELASLNKEMTKLDFALRESPHIQRLKLSLLGARYCSIQGQIAAQLRYQDDSGHIYTIYQTRVNKEFTQRNIQSQLNGISIQQWSEGNLFFGYAVEK